MIKLIIENNKLVAIVTTMAGAAIQQQKYFRQETLGL